MAEKLKPKGYKEELWLVEQPWMTLAFHSKRDADLFAELLSKSLVVKTHYADNYTEHFNYTTDRPDFALKFKNVYEGAEEVTDELPTVPAADQSSEQ